MSIHFGRQMIWAAACCVHLQGAPCGSGFALFQRYQLKYGGVQVKADAVTEHEAEANIEHVQEAYEVLSSHKLRQQYDKIGYSGASMATIVTMHTTAD
jgi:hypothetical protein